MKLKKILSVNILIFLLIFGIIEYYCYSFLCKQAETKIPFFIREYKDYLFDVPFEKGDNTKNTDLTKPPVLLLGCSYAYGERLDSHQNFSSQLQKLTNRQVYNMGVSGHGPLTSLLLLKNEGTKYSYLDKTNYPDTIIYVYMFSHIQRFGWLKYMYNFMRKQNYFPVQKYNFLYNLHIVQYIQNIKLDKEYISVNPDKNYDIWIKTIKNMKKESEKLFPNSRFILLIYSDINSDLCEGHIAAAGNNPEYLQKEFDIMYSKKFREDLEKLGILVVTTEELIGHKMDKPEYRIPQNTDPNYPHPSALSWEEITPKLVKKFNL